MLCMASGIFFSVNGLAGKEVYLVHPHGKTKIISQYIIISKLILIERVA